MVEVWWSVWWFVLSGVVGIVVGTAYAFSRRQDLKKKLDAANRVSTDLFDDLKEAQRLNHDQQQHANRCLAQAELADRKREAQFQVIVDLEKERDDWRDRYQQHALEHGNAQGLLFNECARLTRNRHAIIKGVEAVQEQLRKEIYDSKQVTQLLEQLRRVAQLEIKPEIRRLVAQFHEEHVQPQLKRDPSQPAIIPDLNEIPPATES